MPSTYTHNLYHAVFSTKRRVASISVEVQERLYPFMGGVLRDLECVPIAINGMEDHVHIVTRFPSKLAVSDMLRHVKQRSSEWIHDTFPAMRSFGWQDGYGGFTVSKSGLDDVASYVRNQKEHHQRFSSLDEFVELLKRHAIEFEVGMLE